jgi:hypothetical protein
MQQHNHVVRKRYHPLPRAVRLLATFLIYDFHQRLQRLSAATLFASPHVKPGSDWVQEAFAKKSNQSNAQKDCTSQNASAQG